MSADFFAKWCVPCRMMYEKLSAIPPSPRSSTTSLLLRIDVDRPFARRPVAVNRAPDLHRLSIRGQRPRFRASAAAPAAVFGQTLDAFRRHAAAISRDRKRDHSAENAPPYMRLGVIYDGPERLCRRPRRLPSRCGIG